MQWFNFINIIQVTNKAPIKFFHQKKSCYILILSQYLHPLKGQESSGGKIYFCGFDYSQTLKFVYPILHVIINFYV